MQAESEELNWPPEPFKQGETWCPKCSSLNVKVLGHHSDGYDLNIAVDCLDCGFEWEQRW